MPNLRGIYVLRENLIALMRKRGMTQDELARAVGRKKSWLNKFLKGSRQIQLVDIDSMADYLGVSTYQLFQPGITRTAERRVGERRTGKDRRLALEFRSSGDNDFPRADGDPGHNGRSVSAAGELTPATKSLIEAAVREYTAHAATDPRKAAKTRSGKPRLR